ncbi:phosphotransferase enzyme family protein [Colletotrichum tofieldiae]|uniref:Phosphotransferase enzyme family protein n=1 Tax=Colletotrichum tofieldiae TaxID=708197 RepID=A0A166T2D2_9PEZI|nr:phosphotransferase enzyme family protein [Colletotrichum tofieldiae]GKT96436.1 phosphotransferase enzyme family protein [Colletotrichum tofieldiae]
MASTLIQSEQLSSNFTQLVDRTSSLGTGVDSTQLVLVAAVLSSTMASLKEPQRVAEIMLSWLGLELVSLNELQTLWAGYGHICAITAKLAATDAALATNKISPAIRPESDGTYRLIIKLISPPRAKGGDEGHLRKMLSYEVEQYFYQEVAPRLADDVAVAKCVASTLDMKGKPRAEELQGLTATIITDLRPQFPVAGEKRLVLNHRQVHAALDWLAKYHSSSWASLPDSLDRFVLPPLEEAKRREAGVGAAEPKLWLNGGYTYLSTRKKEYRSLCRDEYSEWSSAFCDPVEGSSLSIAELVAEFLTPSGRSFETYIHGDVKSENLFTIQAGDRVAFFDFQYAGLGIGGCDLAKLFTCSVPVEMLTHHEDIPDRLPMDKGEKALLERYRETLINQKPPGKGPTDYDWVTFVRHWETALVDWCRFQASWGFWGNTEWLEARVRHILADNDWRNWLEQEVGI